MPDGKYSRLSTKWFGMHSKTHTHTHAHLFPIHGLTGLRWNSCGEFDGIKGCLYKTGQVIWPLIDLRHQISCKTLRLQSADGDFISVVPHPKAHWLHSHGLSTCQIQKRDATLLPDREPPSIKSMTQRRFDGSCRFSRCPTAKRIIHFTSIRGHLFIIPFSSHFTLFHRKTSS